VRYQRRFAPSERPKTRMTEIDWEMKEIEAEMKEIEEVSPLLLFFR